MELFERGRLARSGGATQIDGQVVRGQHEFDRVLLFRAQAIGGDKLVFPAQALELSDAAVDGSDHLAFALETLLCGQLIPRTEDPAGGFLERKSTLYFR